MAGKRILQHFFEVNMSGFNLEAFSALVGVELHHKRDQSLSTLNNVVDMPVALLLTGAGAEKFGADPGAREVVLQVVG